MISLLPAFVNRFWSLADCSSEDGCWPWKDATDDKGYGIFCFCGKKFRAHRIAHEIAIGEVGLGLLVCHRCDNPPCVRPSHLFKGSIIANNIDKMTKVRHRVLFGADHPKTIISPELAQQIRTVKGTQRNVALMFGLSKTTVGRVRRGEDWTSR